jgi:hypothetical protein
LPQQLPALLGKIRIFYAEGSVEVAEVKLADAGERADRIVHVCEGIR